MTISGSPRLVTAEPSAADTVVGATPACASASTRKIAWTRDRRTIGMAPPWATSGNETAPPRYGGSRRSVKERPFAKYPFDSLGTRVYRGAVFGPDWPAMVDSLWKPAMVLPRTRCLVFSAGTRQGSKHGSVSER